MSDLDTVAEIKAALYRLLGMTSADTGLKLQGEATDDVAYQLLTRGTRSAQRWLLRCGYVGWRKRSSALSFSGTDAADGGRSASLPTRFLRAYSPRDQWGRRSALVEASGDRWGNEIEAEERHLTGDLYYFFDTDGTEQLWLARSAAPPATLYLEYHEAHVEWTSAILASAIKFPLECRHLIASEAAVLGMDEAWFPGDSALAQSIERALFRDREHARDYARQGKGPRTLRRPMRFGNM